MRKPSRERLDATAVARGSHVIGDINVTPMVDVMLVLLIIFMVTLPAITAGFTAELPQAEFLKSRPDEENRIELGIDRDGNYYLDREPIRAEDVGAALEQIYATRVEDKILFIKADRGIEYQKVLDAMELARDAGVRLVGAITEQTPGTESPEEAEDEAGQPGASVPR
ncbi:MAG: biopolymer transporter ExbD [Gemmatimonadetes bacterium]|nr:biopolymer transporter ExbD [Gemmatimonadota bacterium]